MENPEEDLRRPLEEVALIGELARPLVHEFNNFLNVFLLQISVMELTAAGPGLDLAVLRTEGKKMANLIRDWQHLIKRKPDHAQKSDLNQTIRDLVARPMIESAVSIEVHLDLDKEPLWIKGALPEARRLCWLLIHSAWHVRAESAPSERAVRVRTEKRQQQAVLTIARDGPALSTQQLQELFDPIRSVGSGLELAACKSLASRLDGRLHAENHAGGIVIQFSADAAAI
jgi:signal transduction histidine kinase